MTEPALLLLDEPEAGLDAESIERTQTLTKRHVERGGAVVMASHEPLFKEEADGILELTV